MFYKLKYDVTVYDVPRAMMLPSQCYHHNVTITMLPFTKYNLLSYDFAVLPQSNNCLPKKSIKS